MKALSLIQPHASAIMLGHNKIETRSWTTKYHGQLATATKARQLLVFCRTKKALAMGVKQKDEHRRYTSLFKLKRKA